MTLPVFAEICNCPKTSFLAYKQGFLDHFGLFMTLYCPRNVKIDFSTPKIEEFSADFRPVCPPP